MSDEARREAAEEAFQSLSDSFATYNPIVESYRETFIRGAEWEASRPVSDEEVRVFATFYFYDSEPMRPGSINYQDLKAALEAFVAARRGTK